MTSLPRLTSGIGALRALADYGILDAQTTGEVMGSKLSTDDIRRLYRTLESHKLVIKKSTGPHGRNVNYYQICQNHRKLEEIASMLNVDADYLSQPGIHFTNLLHEQACARVQRSLKLRYPEALVMRDWQFHTNPEVRGLFPKFNLEYKMYPDLTLKLHPSERNPKPTWIGVEVERTKKSDERISDKIQLYASRSFFDGVIYFSPKDLLLRRIELIFSGAVKPDAHRINYYGDYFLAGATLPEKVFDADRLLVSCGPEVVGLTNWISFLHETPTLERGRKRPERAM